MTSDEDRKVAMAQVRDGLTLFETRTRERNLPVRFATRKP